MSTPSLGLKRIEALHYYVRDLSRSRRFYVDRMDFAEIGESSPELTAQGRQHSLVFRAGDCTIVCSEPVGEGGRASRYLHIHPDGIGTIVFEVEDIARTFRVLEERGGTPIDDIRRFEDEGGSLQMFSITTPFGDTTFRFIERAGYRALFPGLTVYDAPRGGGNAFGFVGFDHVTSTFRR
jgi:4-hydroxyphenylpyruvate dioxygenase